MRSPQSGSLTRAGQLRWFTTHERSKCTCQKVWDCLFLACTLVSFTSSNSEVDTNVQAVSAYGLVFWSFWETPIAERIKITMRMHSGTGAELGKSFCHHLPLWRNWNSERLRNALKTCTARSRAWVHWRSTSLVLAEERKHSGRELVLCLFAGIFPSGPWTLQPLYLGEFLCTRCSALPAGFYSTMWS